MTRDAPPIGIQEIVGTSPAMVYVRQLIALASRTDVNVVITGETGTGKELVARAIHRSSSLATAPFIAHNCALTSADRFDIEFFGYYQGTSGRRDGDRPGLLKEADGGVLFLDELDCLGLANQAKLLRILDDGDVRPVGSDSSQALFVRFFAATNRSPSSLLTQGHLREDLYYRLRGLEIHLPPLRERREDIPLLADLFLKSDGKRLTPNAAKELARCAWPGNVRQLRSVLRYSSAGTSGSEIDVPNLSAAALDTPDDDRAFTPVTSVRGDGPDHLSLEDAERQVILQALTAHDGNRSRAADALGIHRSTLRRRIRALGIDGRR